MCVVVINEILTQRRVTINAICRFYDQHEYRINL
ncbi:Uncharacterised protein [Pandoraea pulmonicola]|jgi:hypothetical protein|uniref:Uncharacterized protein n=1 Tax=Pandoraea pulmonicola TaxID=93221 RepID=A0AAJ5D2X7_PANPU|nr:Uncharacterised protein [Pandoraea pulmonicola]